MDHKTNGKKIIILTSLFYPEIAANAKRMTHLAEELKERGYDVSVLTAFRYYQNSGSVETKSRWIQEEDHHRIPVIRSYIYRGGEYGNIFKRVLSFFSFMISSVFASSRIRGKADAVIAISPPFTTLLSAYVISRIKKASLIIDIQDIYPETLIALGFLKNKILITMLERLEKFFYKKAAGTVVISDGFRDDVMNKSAGRANVKVIPNWVDIDLFKPGDGTSLGLKNGIRDEFVVMFAGNMGFAQGLETVIECTYQLKQYEDRIKFVFIGEGVGKRKLVELSEKHGLTNVIFLRAVLNSNLPEYLSMAEALLVHLRKNALYRITIPCKSYEYMAMAKPIIMGVEGSALQLIKEAECGIGIRPESPEDLSSAVLKLYNDRELCNRMGRNGREFAVRNYDRIKVLAGYFDFIESCLKRRGSE